MFDWVLQKPLGEILIMMKMRHQFSKLDKIFLTIITT